MHLTPTEVSPAALLAGVVITALASRLAQRASRTGDHLTRIWERETEIYESVLVEASSWSDLRADAARHLRRLANGQDVLITPETDIDEVKRRRLRVQLQMFGRPEVQSAFKSYTESHNEWITNYTTVRSSYSLNQEVRDELRPPQSLFDKPELDRQRDIARKAKESADADEARLIAITGEAVRREPKRTIRARSRPRRKLESRTA